MVFEGWVVDHLSSWLGHFIELQREQLRISLWRAWRTGLTLNDVRLRPEAFEYLQQPFCVASGRIARVQAHVPWGARPSPIVVELDDVEVVLELRSPDDLSEGPAGKRAREAKRALLAALAAAEAARGGVLAAGGASVDAGAAAPDAKAARSVLLGIVHRVVAMLAGRLRLDVRDVTVTLSDPETGAELTLHVPAVRTASRGEAARRADGPLGGWPAEGSALDPHLAAISKHVVVEGVQISWNPDGRAARAAAARAAVEASAKADVAAAAADSGAGDSPLELSSAAILGHPPLPTPPPLPPLPLALPQSAARRASEPMRLLGPTDAVLRLASSVPGAGAVRLRCDAAVPEIPAQLHANQAHRLAAFVAAVQLADVRAAHAPYCPDAWRRGERGPAVARSMWRFAIQAVVAQGDRRRGRWGSRGVCGEPWHDAQTRAHMRRRYVRIWRGALEEGSAAPARSPNLDAIEVELPVGDLASCRAAAAACAAAARAKAERRMRPQRTRSVAGRPSDADDPTAAWGEAGAPRHRTSPSSTRATPEPDAADKPDAFGSPTATARPEALGSPSAADKPDAFGSPTASNGRAASEGFSGGVRKEHALHIAGPSTEAPSLPGGEAGASPASPQSAQKRAASPQANPGMLSWGLAGVAGFFGYVPHEGAEDDAEDQSGPTPEDARELLEAAIDLEDAEGRPSDEDAARQAATGKASGASLDFRLRVPSVSFRLLSGVGLSGTPLLSASVRWLAGSVCLPASDAERSDVRLAVGGLRIDEHLTHGPGVAAPVLVADESGDEPLLALRGEGLEGPDGGRIDAEVAAFRFRLSSTALAALAARLREQLPVPVHRAPRSASAEPTSALPFSLRTARSEAAALVQAPPPKPESRKREAPMPEVHVKLAGVEVAVPLPASGGPGLPPLVLLLSMGAGLARGVHQEEVDPGYHVNARLGPLSVAFVTEEGLSSPGAQRRLSSGAAVLDPVSLDVSLALPLRPTADASLAQAPTPEPAPPRAPAFAPAPAPVAPSASATFSGPISVTLSARRLSFFLSVATDLHRANEALASAAAAIVRDPWHEACRTSLAAAQPLPPPLQLSTPPSFAASLSIPGLAVQFREGTDPPSRPSSARRQRRPEQEAKHGVLAPANLSLSTGVISADVFSGPRGLRISLDAVAIALADATPHQAPPPVFGHSAVHLAQRLEVGRLRVRVKLDDWLGGRHVPQPKSLGITVVEVLAKDLWAKSYEEESGGMLERLDASKSTRLRFSMDDTPEASHTRVTVHNVCAGHAALARIGVLIDRLTDGHASEDAEDSPAGSPVGTPTGDGTSFFFGSPSRARTSEEESADARLAEVQAISLADRFEAVGGSDAEDTGAGTAEAPNSLPVRDGLGRPGVPPLALSKTRFDDENGDAGILEPTFSPSVGPDSTGVGALPSGAHLTSASLPASLSRVRVDTPPEEPAFERAERLSIVLVSCRVLWRYSPYAAAIDSTRFPLAHDALSAHRGVGVLELPSVTLDLPLAGDAFERMAREASVSAASAASATLRRSGISSAPRTPRASSTPRESYLARSRNAMFGSESDAAPRREPSPLSYESAGKLDPKATQGAAEPAGRGRSPPRSPRASKSTASRPGDRLPSPEGSAPAFADPMLPTLLAPPDAPPSLVLAQLSDVELRLVVVGVPGHSMLPCLRLDRLRVSQRLEASLRRPSLGLGSSSLVIPAGVDDYIVDAGVLELGAHPSHTQLLEMAARTAAAEWSALTAPPEMQAPVEESSVTSSSSLTASAAARLPSSPPARRTKPPVTQPEPVVPALPEKSPNALSVSVLLSGAHASLLGSSVSSSAAVVSLDELRASASRSSDGEIDGSVSWRALGLYCLTPTSDDFTVGGGGGPLPPGSPRSSGSSDDSPLPRDASIEDAFFDAQSDIGSRTSSSLAAAMSRTSAFADALSTRSSAFSRGLSARRSSVAPSFRGTDDDTVAASAVGALSPLPLRPDSPAHSSTCLLRLLAFGPGEGRTSTGELARLSSATPEHGRTLPSSGLAPSIASWWSSGTVPASSDAALRVTSGPDTPLELVAHRTVLRAHLESDAWAEALRCAATYVSLRRLSQPAQEVEEASEPPPRAVSVSPVVARLGDIRLEVVGACGPARSDRVVAAAAAAGNAAVSPAADAPSSFEPTETTAALVLRAGLRISAFESGTAPALRVGVPGLLLAAAHVPTASAQEDFPLFVPAETGVLGVSALEVLVALGAVEAQEEDEQASGGESGQARTPPAQVRRPGGTAEPPSASFSLTTPAASVSQPSAAASAPWGATPMPRFESVRAEFDATTAAASPLATEVGPVSISTAARQVSLWTSERELAVLKALVDAAEQVHERAVGEVEPLLARASSAASVAGRPPPALLASVQVERISAALQELSARGVPRSLVEAELSCLSVRGAARGLEASLEASAVLRADARVPAGWEPLIEPWRAALLASAPLQLPRGLPVSVEEAPPGHVRVELRSSETLELTVTEASLATVGTIVRALDAPSGAEHVPTSWPAPWTLENVSGSRLDVWLHVAGERPTHDDTPLLLASSGERVALPVEGNDRARSSCLAGTPSWRHGVASGEAGSDDSDTDSTDAPLVPLLGGWNSDEDNEGADGARLPPSTLSFRLARTDEICGPVALDCPGEYEFFPTSTGDVRVFVSVTRSRSGAVLAFVHSGVRLVNDSKLAAEVSLRDPSGSGGRTLGKLAPGAGLWVPALAVSAGALSVRPTSDAAASYVASSPVRIVPPPELRPPAPSASRALRGSSRAATASADRNGAAPAQRGLGVAVPWFARDFNDLELDTDAPTVAASVRSDAPPTLTLPPHATKLRPTRSEVPLRAEAPARKRVQLSGDVVHEQSGLLPPASPVPLAYEWSPMVRVRQLLRESGWSSGPTSAHHAPPAVAGARSMLWARASARGGRTLGFELSVCAPERDRTRRAAELRLGAPLALSNGLPVPAEVSIRGSDGSARVLLNPCERSDLHEPEAAICDSVVVYVPGYSAVGPLILPPPDEIEGSDDGSHSARRALWEDDASSRARLRPWEAHWEADAVGSDPSASPAAIARAIPPSTEEERIPVQLVALGLARSAVDASLLLRDVPSSADRAAARKLLLTCPYWVYNCARVPLALRRAPEAAFASDVTARGASAPDVVPAAWVPPLTLPGDCSSADAASGDATPRGIAALTRPATPGARLFGGISTGSVLSTLGTDDESAVLGAHAHVGGQTRWGGIVTPRAHPRIGARGIQDSMEGGAEFARPTRWPSMQGSLGGRHGRVRLQLRATQAMSPPGRSYWSEGVRLDALGGAAVVVAPRPMPGAPRAAMLLAVTASPVGPRSPGALAVRVLPRHVLHNALPVAVQVRQVGTRTVISVPPGGLCALSWADASRARRIRVRVHGSGWLWSGGFDPDVPGDAFVKLRHRDRGETLLLRVDVAGSARGTLHVTLSHTAAGFAPYRLENHTLHAMIARQTRAIEAPGDVIRPYCCLQYAWDEPALPHQLTVSLTGGAALGTWNLDAVGVDALVRARGHDGPRFRIVVRAEGPTRVLAVIDPERHPILQAPTRRLARGRGARPDWEVAAHLAGIGLSLPARGRSARVPLEAIHALGPAPHAPTRASRGSRPDALAVSRAAGSAAASISTLPIPRSGVSTATRVPAAERRGMRHRRRSAIVASSRRVLARPVELAYLRFSSVELLLRVSDARIEARAGAGRVQLDDPRPWRGFPVVLACPAPAGPLTRARLAPNQEGERRSVRALRLQGAMWRRRPAGVLCVEDADVRVAPVALYLQQDHVAELIAHVNRLAKAFGEGGGRTSSGPASRMDGSGAGVASSSERWSPPASATATASASASRASSLNSSSLRAATLVCPSPRAPPLPDLRVAARTGAARASPSPPATAMAPPPPAPALPERTGSALLLPPPGGALLGTAAVLPLSPPAGSTATPVISPPERMLPAVPSLVADDPGVRDVAEWDVEAASLERRLYLARVRMSPLEVHVSFAPARYQEATPAEDPEAAGQDGAPGGVLARALLALADVEDARVSLAGMRLDDAVLGSDALVAQVQRHYVRALLPQVVRVVGAASLLGDPIRLVHHLRLGVWSFLATPAAGLVESAREWGPRAFLLALRQGTTQLLANVVFAFSNATTKASRAAHRALVAVSDAREALAKPSDAGQALAVAAAARDGLLGALLAGALGLFGEPIRGLEREGLPGLVRGLGRGVTGAAVLPLAALLEMLTRTTASVRAAVAGRSTLGWARPPRLLDGSRTLERYDFSAALASWVLVQLGGRNGDSSPPRALLCARLRGEDEWVIVTPSEAMAVHVPPPRWVPTVRWRLAIEDVELARVERDDPSCVLVVTDRPLPRPRPRGRSDRPPPRALPLAPGSLAEEFWEPPVLPREPPPRESVFPLDVRTLQCSGGAREAARLAHVLRKAARSAVPTILWAPSALLADRARHGA